MCRLARKKQSRSLVAPALWFGLRVGIVRYEIYIAQSAVNVRKNALFQTNKYFYQRHIFTKYFVFHKHLYDI